MLLAISLSLSNTAFVHLSVPLIQMLKAATPVMIYLIGLISGTEQYMLGRACNVVFICLGVFISARGSIEYTFVGIAGQMAAIIADSVRCVLLQREMQHGSTDPLEALASFAPLAAMALILPSVVEWRESSSTCSRYAQALMCVSCVIVFALNVVICQLIKTTSALTTSLTGIVKEWICIGLTMEMYKVVITPTQWLGYVLSVLGLVWYYGHGHLRKQTPTCSRST